MCFYDAERVLSVIAKFLVHLSGNGQCGVEKEGEERERRCFGRKGNGNPGKIAQNATYLALWGWLWGYRPVPYIF